MKFLPSRTPAFVYFTQIARNISWPLSWIIYVPGSHFWWLEDLSSPSSPPTALRSAKNETRSPRCAIRLSNHKSSWISHYELFIVHDFLVWCQNHRKMATNICLFESTQFTKPCWPKWGPECKCAKPTNNECAFFFPCFCFICVLFLLENRREGSLNICIDCIQYLGEGIEIQRLYYNQ